MAWEKKFELEEVNFMQIDYFHRTIMKEKAIGPTPSPTHVTYIETTETNRTVSKQTEAN
jgi:hypothetical protein